MTQSPTNNTIRYQIEQEGQNIWRDTVPTASLTWRIGYGVHRMLISDVIFWVIVMLAISVTICEIFTGKIYLTLTLPIELVKVKCRYANRKAECDFLYVGNRNV